MTRPDLYQFNAGYSLILVVEYCMKWVIEYVEDQILPDKAYRSVYMFLSES